MRINRLQAAGAAVVLAWAGYTPAASAQAWIGQVVGNMMAQQAAAQQEEACMTGARTVEAKALTDAAQAEARKARAIAALSAGS